MAKPTIAEDDEVPELDISDVTEFVEKETEAAKPFEQLPASKHRHNLNAKKTGDKLVHKGILNPNDNATFVVEYFAAGYYLDSKAIFKKMPLTAMDLEEGKVKPEEFCEAIEQMVYDVVYPSLESQMPTYESVVKNRKEMMGEMTGYLVEMALENVYLSYSSNHPLCQQFARDLKRRVFQYQANDKTHRTDSMFGPVHFYKSALDECLDKYCNTFDKEFYNGTYRAFLNHCPVYNKPMLQFFSITEKMFKRTSNHRQMEIQEQLTILKKALQESVQALATTHADTAKNRCWECHTVHKVGANLLSCSGCHVANYCNRVCQTKAWKTGHNECCGDLIEAHKTFLTSLNLIKEVHGDVADDSEVCSPASPAAKPTNKKNNKKKNRARKNKASKQQQVNKPTGKIPKEFPAKLNELSDYAVFQTMAAQESFEECYYSDEEDEPEEPLMPSMRHFYLNLKSLDQGKFWLYPRPNGSMAEAEDMRGYQTDNLLRNSSAQASQQAEQDYFLRLAHILCFDIKALENHYGGIADIGKALELEGDGGHPMPLQRFIDLYYDRKVTLGSDRERDEQRMRRMKKANAYALLRDAYHK